MNKEDYIKEAERQLHDEQYYAKLMQDPANAFKRDLKMLVQSFHDQDHILKLIPQDPQPGKYYLLPKINKPNNPGHLIVSNKLTLTEKIFLVTILLGQGINAFMQRAN